MDIIHDYDDFISFIRDYKELVSEGDFKNIYNQSNNIKIKNYIIQENLIKHEKNTIIPTLIFCQRETLTCLLKQGGKINTKIDDHNLLDNVMIYYIENEVDIEEYIKYMIFLLQEGISASFKNIKSIILDTIQKDVNNLQKCIIIIDLLYLYGVKQVKCHSQFEHEIFEKSTTIQDILHIILKEVYQEVKLEVIKEKIEVERSIQKTKVNKYIKVSDKVIFMYYDQDTKIFYCFNQEQVKDIIKTRENPYTKKSIDDQIIQKMKIKSN